jgi:uncharacterized protein
LRRSDGTHPGLREQYSWPEGKPFRILSIDGGGIRGILPAAMLTELEKQTDERSVGDYFDLIAGTSTGGIIALALSIGIPANTILDIYLKHGQRVFPRPRGAFRRIREKWRFISGLRHHAYDPAPLKQELTRVFGTAILGNARRRLCIPSFDGFTETYIFKTPHHRDYKTDWRESMVTVAMATAAAPTYFPVYRDRGRYFGDGGIWANDPMMIALVDALVCYKIDRRQVHILSLGTADTEMQMTSQQINLGGVWYWREIISSAMHLQSQNAIGQAGLLVGRDQLIRVNAPPMPDNPIKLDDYDRACQELPAIARQLVKQAGDTIHNRFLFAPAESYPAFYGPRAEENP